MKTYILILLTIIPVIGLSQSIESMQAKFVNLAQRMHNHIAFGSRCEILIEEVSDFNELLDSRVNSDDEYTAAQLNEIHKLKNLSEAYHSFLCAVGASRSAGYLSRNELSLMLNLFDLQLLEINSNQYCIKVFLIKINSYSCWLAYHTGSNTITVSISYSANKKYDGKMDMGLMGESYRSFMNNGKNPLISTLYFTNIECETSFLR